MALYYFSECAFPFLHKREQYSSDIHLKPSLPIGILGLKPKPSLSIELKYFNLQSKVNAVLTYAIFPQQSLSEFVEKLYGKFC